MSGLLLLESVGPGCQSARIENLEGITDRERLKGKKKKKRETFKDQQFEVYYD